MGPPPYDLGSEQVSPVGQVLNGYCAGFPNWFSQWDNFRSKLVESHIVGGKNKMVSGEDFLKPIYLQLVCRHDSERYFMCR